MVAAGGLEQGLNTAVNAAGESQEIRGESVEPMIVT